MHLLLKNIQWDCDGMDPVVDCLLPINVLAVNVPYTLDGDTEGMQQHLGELLSDAYGFMHYGFEFEPINLDGVRQDGGYRSAIPWHSLCDAVMEGNPYTV
jgi:hypothetical protein